MIVFLLKNKFCYEILFLIVLVLNSICLLFSQWIIFCPVTFRLSFKGIIYKQHIVLAVYIRFSHLSLLIGVFSPFLFNVIIDMVGLSLFTVCFHLFWLAGLFIYGFSVPSFLPSYMLKYFNSPFYWLFSYTSLHFRWLS